MIVSNPHRPNTTVSLETNPYLKIKIKCISTIMVCHLCLLSFLGSCSWGSSSKSFIYSLYNINGYAPVKLQIKSGQTSRAILSCSGWGPVFGIGDDFRISDNARSNRISHTRCGYTYSLPPGYSSRSSCTFYAGSFQFTPTDVEVFYEITTNEDKQTIYCSSR